MKSLAKGLNKQETDYKELSESLEYICEHHHINSKLGKFAHDKNKANPGQVDRGRTYTVVINKAPGNVIKNICLCS